MLARTPWARTATKAMSATPTVRAAAVVAVRPGFRVVFWRASSPVPRVNGSTGFSMAAASGPMIQRDAPADAGEQHQRAAGQHHQPAGRGKSAEDHRGHQRARTEGGHHGGHGEAAQP